MSSYSRDQKTALKDYNLIMSAYHEAGHVVIGILNMFDIIECSIVETKNAFGFTKFLRLRPEDTSGRLQKKVMNAYLNVLQAGVVAEKIQYFNMTGIKKLPSYINCGGQSDSIAIGRTLQKFKVASNRIEKTSFRVNLKYKIEKDLSCCWDEVTAVARLLFKHKRVSAQLIRHTILSNSKDKKFWINTFKSIEEIYGPLRIAA